MKYHFVSLLILSILIIHRASCTINNKTFSSPLHSTCVNLLCCLSLLMSNLLLQYLWWLNSDPSPNRKTHQEARLLWYPPTHTIDSSYESDYTILVNMKWYRTTVDKPNNITCYCLVSTKFIFSSLELSLIFDCTNTPMT